MTHPLSTLYINGDWTTGRGGALSSENPATRETLWRGDAAGAEDVGQAVAAARAAFPAWARTSLAERISMIEAYGRVLEAWRGDIAGWISKETGKPAWEGDAEAGAMIGKIAISIAAYAERTGETSADTAFGATRLVHKPHGVMAVLGPFNFPGHLPNGHIVPALLAGDTAVFKPSEQTPAVGALMVQAWAEAGLPTGVLNMVQGGRETGAALLDADIDGVLFTGSMEAGVAIHRKFAGRPDVMLALEMGGNAPLIAWDAADAEAAAAIAAQSAFISSGQRCTCARRLIVPADDRGDAILSALADLTPRLRVNAWDADPEPFMGPVINERSARRVMAAQDDWLNKGGRAVLAAKSEEGSAFVTPGVIDVTDVEVDDDEVFGPLVQVRRAPDFDTALDIANATRFGLAAGLISDRADLWDQFSADIRAGIVNWNRPTTGAASTLPFGGVGLSGNHRPSAAYAADYCAYPMASQTAATPVAPPFRGLSAA